MKRIDLEKKIRMYGRFELIFIAILIVASLGAIYTQITLYFITIIICFINMWGCKIARIIYEVNDGSRK